MGFFAEEIPAKARATTRAPSSRSFDIASSPRGCDHCSLQKTWASLRSPQMEISGNTRNPEVLALGEAPGEEEDRDGIAFTGASGRLLRSVIPGRDLDRVVFQNTVRCRPAGNATPGIREQHACSIHLEADLERLPTVKAILGIGSIPLGRMLSGFGKAGSISNIHGTRFPVQIAGRTLWYYPVLHPSYVLRTAGWNRPPDHSPAYGPFKSDIKRFFNEFESWPEPKIFDASAALKTLIYPKTYEEAKTLSYKIRAPRAIDIETFPLKPFTADARLLTASLSDGVTTLVWPVEHPEAPNPWGLRFLLDVFAGQPWCAHNAAFEFVWATAMAEREGIKGFEPAPFEDSMGCVRLYHERETLIGLDIASRIHLGVDVKSLVKVNRSRMIDEPLERILPYNGLDAIGSRLIFDQARPHVNAANYNRFIGSIHSTARMELLGLPADLEENAALKKQWQTQREDAQRDASTIFEVRRFEAERQQEFNIASNADIGIALVEYGRVDLKKTEHKNEDGKKVDGELYDTGEQELRAKAPDNPLVKAVLEFREAQKQESTYVDSVRRIAEHTLDHCIHPSYSTMLVATTRLSSEGPNIQNFPKRKHRELRRQIVAPKGHLLLSFDYGQLEARVYACLTKDKSLCQSIISGNDIHARWRDRALELHPDYYERLKEKTNETVEKEVLKGGRDIIKSDFTFAAFYGSIASSIAERMGLPLRIAEKLLAEFWGEYKEAYAWVKSAREAYKVTGSAVTLCGVVRHGIMWGNEMINTPVQGSAAHVVAEGRNALSYLSIAENEPCLHPRIDIHDDLTFIVPDDDDVVAAFVDIIAEELVKVRFDWQIVPWMVDAKIGYNWADLFEVKRVVGDYNR